METAIRFPSLEMFDQFREFIRQSYTSQEANVVKLLKGPDINALLTTAGRATADHNALKHAAFARYRGVIL